MPIGAGLLGVRHAPVTGSVDLAARTGRYTVWVDRGDALDPLVHVPMREAKVRLSHPGILCDRTPR